MPLNPVCHNKADKSRITLLLICREDNSSFQSYDMMQDSIETFTEFFLVSVEPHDSLWCFDSFTLIANDDFTTNHRGVPPPPKLGTWPAHVGCFLMFLGPIAVRTLALLCKNMLADALLKAPRCEWLCEALMSHMTHLPFTVSWLIITHTCLQIPVNSCSPLLSFWGSEVWGLISWFCFSPV